MGHAGAVTVLTRAAADAALVAAVDRAREVLLEDVAGADVGEHLGHVVEGDRVVTHRFACRRRGYAGWQWAVTLARAPRQRHVTVDEVVLLPGEEAIVAPSWVPYRERIKPGDLSPGDLLPVTDDDPRLVPTYSTGDDPLDPDELAQVRDVGRELYAGRVRTMSVEGRDLAAQRWYDGEGGPDSPLAQAAPEPCTTCGFLMRLHGPLAEMFGVCGNGDANDDGRAVSLDHGCGAHSEVRLAKRHAPPPLPEPVFDTMTRDELEAL